MKQHSKPAESTCGADKVFSNISKSMQLYTCDNTPMITESLEF